MKRYRPIRCMVNNIFYQKGMGENKDGEWVKYEEAQKEGSGMSAELTYLRGVINCALGKSYPSDIGCENHELIKKIEKKDWTIKELQGELNIWLKGI